VLVMLQAFEEAACNFGRHKIFDTAEFVERVENMFLIPCVAQN